ncbi:MAG TPA: MFS transporter [Saprospiraceae bacterium]|nr:MFS transporter [Saprospiraceae bacterium]
MPDRLFYLLFLFVICFAGVTFGAMDSVLAPAYLPEILRDMGSAGDAETAARVGAWINFSFLAGGSVGGILLSFISDRIGCRKVLALSLLLYGAGSGLGIYAPNWELLAVTRFLVGTGVGAALVVTVVMIANAWTKASAVALGILSVAYPVGIILSGIITTNVDEWRTAFLIGAIPALLALPVYLLTQETIMPKVEGQSSRRVSFASYQGKLISGILVYGSMLIGLWAAFSWLPTWVQSLNDDTVAVGLSERGTAVILLGLGGLMGGIISGWLSNTFSAWRVQALCFIICLLLSLFLFKLNLTYSMWVLVGSGLLGFTFGVSQGVLNIFIPALFPVEIRAGATGLCFHTGRIFTAIAVFFVGAWAIALGGYGNAIFTFSLVYVIGLMALLGMKRKGEG